MREFVADLHVHTCLSPCAEREMTPPGIVKRAGSAGVDIIGVCDHNSAENVPSVIRAALGSALRVLAGIEVTTQEEVHILGLFDEVEAALGLQELIYGNLPGENDAEAFGSQLLMDESGRSLGSNPRFLLGATELSLERVVGSIRARRGLALASHVDREAFSLVGQLGFIPEGLELDGLEISWRMGCEEAGERFRPWPVVKGSDAHRLEDIGRCTTSFFLKEATAREIGLALRREGGRAVICC